MSDMNTNKFEETILDQLTGVQKYMEKLDKRIRSIEQNDRNSDASWQDMPRHAPPSHRVFSGVDTSLDLHLSGGNKNSLYHYLDVGALGPSGQTRPAEILQEEFEVIKDCTSNIRLPAGLKVPSSREGLRRENQPLFNVIQKCARFTETSLKILSTFPEGRQDIHDLIVVQTAMIKYLTDELCAVLVSGVFKPQSGVGKAFRMLQRNQAFADSSNVAVLRDASQIAPALMNQQQQQRFPDRGGYQRGGYRSNNSRGRGQLNNRGFNNWQYNNSFPPRRAPQPPTSSNNNQD